MELRDVIEILRRRWVAATVVTLLVLAAVALATLVSTPRYTSTTRMFFAVQGTESVTDLTQGSTFAEKQMSSYAQVASSPLVLDPVVRQLGLSTTSGELARSLSVVVPADTVILEVSVTRTDPQEATAIANAVGQELAQVAGDLSPAGAGQAVKATILAPAQVPQSQSSPHVLRNLVLGLLLGLVLGVAYALFRQVLDNRVRTESDVRAITDRPLLCSIGLDTLVHDHRVVVASDPTSTSAEAIRRLRTNLQFVGAGSGAKSLVITSSLPGEGKSTTSVNLAVSLADAGSRVLLVDADLRRPSLAEYLGLEGAAGLTTVLIGRAEVADVVQVWQNTRLHVLTAGQIPPNPSELLGSSAMTTLLAQLSRSYDVILLDSPPLLPVTDATILTTMTGGALVVVGADRLHRNQLAEALGALDTAGAKVHGLVLNKVARSASKGYGYGGYYSSTEPVVVEPDVEHAPAWEQPTAAGVK